MLGDDLPPADWAALARAAVEANVLGRPAPAADRGEAAAATPYGVAVSIKLMGEPRGEASRFGSGSTDLAAEVMALAVQAAADDPRFVAVSSAELPLLSYAVDLYGEPEAAHGAADLAPARYAALVELAERQALVPAGVEGIDTAARQLALALQAAGIDPGEPYRLRRSRVHHHAEPDFDRRRPVMDDDDE